ncbi:MAG: hypothetical protein HUJ92_02630 [Bacteroidales bacterium]|nr:hypothetical protein [Bacteroidales bacterium]
MKKKTIYDDSFYSSEAKEILFKLPPWIIRSGSLVFFVAFSLIISSLFLIRCPERIDCDIQVFSNSTSVGLVYLNEIAISKISKGQDVNVKLERFPYMQYGVINGKVEQIIEIFDTNENNEVIYKVQVAFPKGLVTNWGFEIPKISRLSGTSEILVSDRPLFYIIFNSFNVFNKRNTQI